MLARILRTLVWLPALVGLVATSAWSGTQAPTGAVAADPFPNDPQALGRTETSGVTAIDSGSFVLAFRKDSNVFLGYSAEDGSWDRYEFLEKVVAVPITTGGGYGFANGGSAAAAFKLSGDAIDELVAVDRHGKFHATKLEQPASGQLTPLISDGMVLHVVDETVYAFSGKTGTWDALKVPKGSVAEVRAEGSFGVRGLIFTGAKAVYSVENGCSIFSVESGKWTSAKFDADLP